MKAPIQRLTRTVLFAIAILTACWCWAEERDQILFLHLRLKDGVVTLVRSSVKPGRLKTPIASDRKGEIHLELTATNGLSLWSDVMADPTVQRLEYEDPEHPGALKLKEVKVTEAEFIVRVPFHKDAKQLELQRLDRPANRAEAGAPGTKKKLLGTVAIPATEGAP
jgi:hypothetical protein